MIVHNNKSCWPSLVVALPCELIIHTDEELALGMELFVVPCR